MYKSTITPYEGPQPYIFVSYAHKDSEQVLKIMELLSARGYRIWYDDGIAPGSEWPEYIATHLSGSQIVLSFISPNSIASSNCRREVTFALAQNKHFIGIYLCETKMSPGMEMQLSAQQCIMKYSLSDEAFLKKLCSVEDVLVCQAPPEEPSVKTVSSAQAETAEPPHRISDEDMEAVKKMKKAVQEENKSLKELHSKGSEKPSDKSSKKPRSKGSEELSAKSSKKPHSKKLLLVAVAVVIAVFAVGVIAFMPKSTSSSGTSITIAGSSYTTSNTSITLKSALVDDSAVAELNKLTKLVSLTLTSCEVTGDLSQLNVSQLTTLKAAECKFSDLKFLTQAANLSSLTLDDCNLTDTMLSDLTSLGKLRTVNLSNNAAFTAISLLPLSTLTSLEVSGTAVSDFATIAALEKLRTLDIGNTSITVADDQIHSINLTSLSIDNLKLKDYSFMDSLTALTSLSVQNCGITDLATVLQQNSGTLKAVYLEGNSLNSETTNALASCKLTEKLYIDGNQTGNLDFVKNMTSLNTCSAVGCGLTDVSGLEGCSQLTKLYLSDNSISTINLSGLSKLKEVYLNDNKITDFSSLPNCHYTYLLLQGNPIDHSTLPALSSTADRLVLDYVEGLEDSKALSSFYYVYIVDCPLNKQLAMKKAASLSTYFVSKEDMDEALKACALNNSTNWTQYISQ